MNSDSLFENSQLVVSYELLQFLRWVVMTEPESLQVLMRQSLATKTGYGTDTHLEDIPNNEELQRSVIDFFDLLEHKLQETIHMADYDMQPAEQVLSPTVNSIDSSLCDENTVALSIAAASHSNMATAQHAKEVLYKELLKNWRPRNKHLLH